MKHSRVLGLAGLLAATVWASGLSAQDLTLTKFDWANPVEPPDTLPVFEHLGLEKVPEGMERLDGYAYAVVSAVVNERGKVLSFGVQGTHPWLNHGVLDISRRKVKPAKRDGLAVNSAVWAAIIFNPRSAPAKGDEAQPRLLWATPVPWEDAPKDFSSTTLSVKLTVTDKGSVGDIELPEEVKPSVAKAVRRALERWEFAPARHGGIAKEATIEMPVLLVAPVKPVAASKDMRLPEPVVRVKPEYPKSQRIAGYQGKVLIQFVVDIEGKVRNPFVAQSNNPAFDEPAITALLKWRFKPAMKDGQPVNCLMQVPIYFQLDEGGYDPFSVRTSKKSQDHLPPEFRFDTAPRLTNVESAVYPYDALLKKTRGVVEFNFAIDREGRALFGRAVKTPGDEFTRAVAAWVDTMRFQPALKDGKPTNAALSMKLEFDEKYGEVALSNSALDILQRLQSKHADRHFAGLGDLDSNVHPVSRRPPVFPHELPPEVTKGEALIEFFIDGNGIAQLPHIISATDPAFGYSACQAVASWRFTPPMQDGHPVVVRARIPIEFKLK